VNDRFGYAVGDDVIRAVADAMVESGRKSDLVARFGGDEFVLLAVDARPHASELLMQRVEAKMAGLSETRGLPVAVQCSVGVASSRVPPPTVDELLREADENMRLRQAQSESGLGHPRRFASEGAA